MTTAKIMSITSSEAFNLLHLPVNQTKFFSGTYTKLDGTERTFNGRRKVTKYLKGGTLAYNPDDRGNVVYWDRHAEGYRTIKTDNMNTLRIGRQDYIIVNPPKVEIIYEQ